MKRWTLLRATALSLLATTGWAEGWEVEAGAGLLGSADFGSFGPFSYRGVQFARELTNCPLEFRDHPRGPEFGCFARLGFFGSFNAIYTREHEYGPTPVLDLAVRRVLNGAFSMAFGILGGLAPGRQRVAFEAIPLSLDVPPIPGEVRDALANPDFTEFRHTDTSALAYLHAGLRYEWLLGRGGAGRARRAQTSGIFLDAGGGVLPIVPGGGESQVGAPLGWHVGAGIRWARGLSRDLTLSLLHVRALSHPPDGIEARYSWTGFRMGWIFER